MTGRAEPLSPGAATAAGGLLGAALIVRDEAANLPACLESIRGVVDDIVIVDTGSADDSVAIATRYGARVFSRPWDGDFAAARNSGLDWCGTDWILYIDADERLAPVSRDEVESLLSGAPEVAFRLLLRPIAGSTPYREYRLWRNDPRIRFRNTIHEKVWYSIEDVSAADGRPIGSCDLLLEHVGYEGDQTRKHLRNLPLLLRQIPAEPDNLFLWHHLGRVLAGIGQRPAARAVLTHALVRARRGGYLDQCGALCFSELIGMGLADARDVASLVAEGRRAYPGDCVLLWQEGRYLVAAGRADALLRFDALLSVDQQRLPDYGPAYDQRLFGDCAHEGRALCLFRLGRYAEAAEAYAQASRHAPEVAEYAVKRQLALALGRRAEPAGAVAP